MIGNNQYINLPTPNIGSFICGGAGSGKTESFFEPLLWQMGMQNKPGYVYDFKDFDLTRVSYSAYKYFNSDLDFRIINFRDLKRTYQVNPIHPDYIKEDLFINEYVDIFLQSLAQENKKNKDYFSKSARLLFRTIVTFLRNQEPEHCTIPHAILFLNTMSIKEIVNVVKIDPICKLYARQFEESLELGAGEEVSGVVNTLRVDLNQLISKEIFWVLNGNDFSLDLNNPNNPTLLNAVNYQPLSNATSPILTLITAVVIKQMNQDGKLPSDIVLDESPTIRVQKLYELPATCRSKGVALHLGVQDFSQIDLSYTKDERRAIVANLGNQFYFRCFDLDTVKYISELFDSEDRVILSKGKSINQSVGRNVNASIQQRKIIKPSDVTKLKNGEAISLLANAERNRIRGQIKRVKDDPFYGVNSSKLFEIPEFSNITNDLLVANFNSIFDDTEKIKNKYLN